jgi:hypothetical protein
MAAASPACHRSSREHAYSRSRMRSRCCIGPVGTARRRLACSRLLACPIGRAPTHKAHGAHSRRDLRPNAVAPHAASMGSRRALISSVSFSARMQKCQGSHSIYSRRPAYSGFVRLHAWWFSTILFETVASVAHPMGSTVRRTAEMSDRRLSCSLSSNTQRAGMSVSVTRHRGDLDDPSYRQTRDRTTDACASVAEFPEEHS